MPESERRLAAIMFTDMVGYTSLAQSNEALALAVLENQYRLLRPIFSRYHGREVKTIGDSLLIEFDSALNATDCAIDIQKRLHEYNVSSKEESRVRIRIGIHLGDVVFVRGDLLGDAVNIASRIEPLAEAGGICVSEQVFDQVRNKISYPLLKLAPIRLKNIRWNVGVYKIVMPWEDGSAPNVSHETVTLDSHRVVVLPFANMSPDPNDEYFADGMTEELISVLSNVGELEVISRTSARKFKGGGRTVGEIAHELNVGTVLEGSVRKWEDSLRIAVQLIDANSDKHLWTQTYDRKLEDIFSLQTEIAERVADNLKIKLVGGETAVITDRQTRNIDAYNLYLQGRYHWNRRTQSSLEKAIECFEKAIDIDPGYALAYSGIADSYLVLAIRPTYPTLATSEKAKQYAMRALEINNLLPEAHASLALSLEYAWDWTGAEKEFRRAIELRPNYSTAHHWYALLLKALGRFDEAIQEIKLAEEADPLSHIIATATVSLLSDAKRYAEAIERAKRALELEPNFMMAHETLADVYLRMKMYNEALAEAQIVVNLDPDDFYKTLLTFHQMKVGQKSMAEVKAAIGHLVDLSKTQHVSPRILAWFHALVHDEAPMFDCLKRAFDEHDMQLGNFRFNPDFEPYRDDPRFTSLIQKMGLERLSPST